jgi:hypothetical protein
MAIGRVFTESLGRNLTVLVVRPQSKTGVTIKVMRAGNIQRMVRHKLTNRVAVDKPLTLRSVDDPQVTSSYGRPNPD